MPQLDLLREVPVDGGERRRTARFRAWPKRLRVRVFGAGGESEGRERS